jgi:hypothetical protein
MPILGDPDKVQVNREDGMGAMTILTHASKLTKNLLKLLPKGGSFNPPNWRQ